MNLVSITREEEIFKLHFLLQNFYLLKFSLCLHNLTFAPVFFLLKQEPELKTLDNSAQIFNALSDVPGDVQDVDELIDVSVGVSCVQI